jgi:hypothetical protein
MNHVVTINPTGTSGIQGQTPSPTLQHLSWARQPFAALARPGIGPADTGAI